MYKDDTQQKISKEEQLVNDHRKLLIVSGMLSEFQLENLKKWPFAVFGTDLASNEISYDFKMAQPDEVNARDIFAGQVEFNLSFKKKPEEEELSKLLPILTLWTKFLFWQDTEVTFRIEGKKWEA